MTTFKNFLWTLLVPGTAVVLLPWWLTEKGIPEPVRPSLWLFLGWILVALGAGFYFSSLWKFDRVGKGTPAPFDPPKRFVAVGPYRRVRNPMYVGVILVILGQALLTQSLPLLVYAASLWIAFHLWTLFYEEPNLRRKFGKSYESYLHSVPRWIPRGLPGWKMLSAGSVGALGVVALHALFPGFNDVPFLALFLAYTACVYFGAALAYGKGQWLALEVLFSLLVFTLAFLGLERSPSFIAAGFVLHGIWDALHHRGTLKTPVLPWFPPLCAAFDFAIAAVLWLR